jgi:segregation and condensation protein A
MAVDALTAPSVRLEAFEGPLDLLFHLIEKNRVSIYDIPIGSIADQYVDYLAGLARLDLEIASEFLLMAATLLQIKSRMLLPAAPAAEGEETSDPRDELVLRLLEYRRCKTLANELRTRQQTWGACLRKLPETAESLGLLVDRGDAPPLSREAFYAACAAVCDRNAGRFNDLSEKVVHLLKRERVSMRDKMRQLWQALIGRTKAWFAEIFPPSAPRMERVTGFLALLELLRLGRIEAEQPEPFAPIRLSALGASDDGRHDWFDAPEGPVRETWKEYR